MGNTTTELEIIDYLAQIVNHRKAIEQGYAASTRWLCTREDLKEECKKEALLEFEEWKQEELMAQKSLEESIPQIKWTGSTN